MAKLKELGIIITGNTPKTSEPQNYNSNDILFVKPSDIADNNVNYIESAEYYISEFARGKARIIPVNSVLVTCIGIIGKIAINKVECSFNQQINAIIPDPAFCLPEYLAYALYRKKDILQSIANAPVVPILNKTQFSEIEIELPALSDQVQIIKKLSVLDTIINDRKQQVQKLDELIKARFVEMFGMVGTDEKGWGLSRLGDICKINPKKTADSKLKSGLQVSFIPMSAVSEKGEINPTEIKTYDDVKTGFTYFCEGDVIFAKITPCMENGKGAVAKGLCNGIGFGSTEFHVLRPIENISNPYWIYSVTAFNQFRIDAASNMTGSAGQRRVPASFLDSYKVALPPIELQNEFAAFVEQVDKSKFEVHQSLEKLEILKKSLMQKYFG